MINLIINEVIVWELSVLYIEIVMRMVMKNIVMLAMKLKRWNFSKVFYSFASFVKYLVNFVKCD